MSRFLAAFLIFTAVALITSECVDAACPFLCPGAMDLLTPLLIGECMSYSDSIQYCACRSGRSGPACDESYSSRRCKPPSAGSSSDVRPTLVNIGFVNETLTVKVKSPYISNRYSTQVSIDRSSTRSICHYPGPAWTKSNDDASCSDIYTASISWSAISGDNCGWTLDSESDENYHLYTANLTIRHRDSSGFLSARTTVYIYPIRLRMPKNPNVDGDVTPLSEITVNTAVVSQIASSLDRSATIVFATDTTYPYKLKEPTLTSGPQDVNVTVREVGTAQTCQDNASETCTQLWEVKASSNSKCAVSGNYHFDFRAECHPKGINKCDLAENVDATAVSLRLKSESLCAETSMDLTLAATLTPYRDAARTVVANDFFAESIIFWRMTAATNNSVLGGVKIASAKITPDVSQDATYTYTKGMIQKTDDTFKITMEGTNYVDFQVAAVAANGFAASGDVSAGYTLSARLELSYADLEGKKRAQVISSIKNFVAISESFTIRSPVVLGLESTLIDTLNVNASTAAATFAWSTVVFGIAIVMLL